MNKIAKKENKTVILYMGKHANQVFANTDSGWKKFFQMMDQDMEYYWGIRTGEDLKECKGELKEALEMQKQSKLAPSLVVGDVKAKILNIPYLESAFKESKRVKGIYEKAIKGDVVSIKSLMQLRRSYEYESYDILDLEE